MEKQLTYKQYAWHQFKKNKPAIVSFYLLLLLGFIAIASPFLANNQPLFVKHNSTNYYPAFATLFNNSTGAYFVDENKDSVWVDYTNTDWRLIEAESIVFAPIAYSSTGIDKYNRDYAHPKFEQRLPNKSGKMDVLPSHLRHHLGTDKLGRDVAAGLVHGARISLLVGLLSMGIAVLIGLFLGAVAGYFGNTKIKVKRLQFWLGTLGVFTGYFYAFNVRGDVIVASFNSSTLFGLLQIFFSVFLLAFNIWFFGKLGKWLALGKWLNKQVAVPIDAFVSRAIEILNSMPILILIISISAILTEKSLWVLMVIIGLTSWTGVARLMRAEMLRIKQMEYIQASQVLGYSNWRIITKHAIPNGLAPIFVTFAFGVASAILTESGLSFLGIGVPDDVVTWGSLLSLGRSEFEAWWLVIYPGLAIFITITVYNLIGEGLRDALDPKHKK